MNVVKYVIISAIALLLLPVTGCGADTDLSELTSKAIIATGEAQSYRTTAVLTYTVDGETGKITYESEFVAPDRVHSKTTRDGDWSETISVGDKTYIRGSSMPQWCESPCQYHEPSSGAVVTAQAVSIPLEKELEPLNWLVDIKELLSEEVDGVECWHYRGKVNMDAHINMLQKRAKGGQTPEHLQEMRHWARDFELWVGKDSYLIVQLKEQMRFTMFNPETGEEDLFTSNTTKRFYDFNKPISIESPL